MSESDSDNDKDTNNPVDIRRVLPMMPIQAIDKIDPSGLSDALDSGDVEAIKREYARFMQQWQDLADSDPAFGSWYAKFKAENAITGNWPDAIADEE